MGDYFSRDIETPDDVAMLEDRAVGTAAKIAYFNTIKNHLRLVESGQQQPADALAHLDDLAAAWMAKAAHRAIDPRRAPRWPLPWPTDGKTGRYAAPLRGSGSDSWSISGYRTSGRTPLK